MTTRYVDCREPELDGALLVSGCYLRGQRPLIQFGVNFMRLQIFIGVLAGDSLPLSGIFTQRDFHGVLVRNNVVGNSGAAGL
jgi:hypothetical protein